MRATSNRIGGSTKDIYVRHTAPGKSTSAIYYPYRINQGPKAYRNTDIAVKIENYSR